MLRKVAVVMAIKFTNLRGPSIVVDGSSADLDSFALPSRNFIIDTPLSILIGFFKASIDGDVLLGVISDKLDIVNSQAISIFLTGTFKFESVNSRDNLHLLCFSSNIMVCRDNVKNFISIPVDIALA